MIPEGYVESLAAALGFDFDIPEDESSMWSFEADGLPFYFSLGSIAASQDSESRPFAVIFCTAFYWDSPQDVSEEIIIDLAKGDEFPFGLRLRTLEDGSVDLSVEHIALLSLSIDHDADSLKFLVGLLAGAAKRIQKAYI
jgi:hypothetical protein